MTRTEERPAATDQPKLFRVREERDRRELFSLLAADRPYAVFAIGHLEDDLYARSRFWVAEGEDGSIAVALHAAGGLGPTTVTVGDPAALDALLSLHPGPRRTVYLATGAPEHLTILGRTFAVSAPLTMIRMSVSASTVRPVESPEAVDLRPLSGRDAFALNALYATGGGPTGYRAAHIDRAVYFGVFDDGQLVAAAGTHLVGVQMGVAVVGNVFTHRDHRGRGHAQLVTSAVTDHLLDHGCPLVTLTVDPSNTPAVRAYRKLGYEDGPLVVEARLRRRSVFGVGATRRRWAARRRSGSPDEAWTFGVDSNEDESMEAWS